MDVDMAFQGAGAKEGLEIWCVQNLRLVPMPKSLHGKFYSGSTYLILNTTLLKSGLAQHNIHYWLGRDAQEVDSAEVSDKAVELDMVLGSHAVQYRELQGHETEKFLSYFKPCIIPIEGVFSSELGFLGSETYRIRLFTCKGDHAVYVNEVPFSRSSLNHKDVFILDTESKIFLFSGSSSSLQERAKALEVVEYITDNNHGGKCEVAAIEDGKFVGDSDVGEFWSLFGGYAPIARDPPSTIEKKPGVPSSKLYWLTQEKMSLVETSSLKKEMLSADKCYMLDCIDEIFVWMGRNTTISERHKSVSSTEGFVNTQGRSTNKVTLLSEGCETTTFKSYFGEWSETSVTNLYEEGRGKVAALFKKQGYEVKELPEEDFQPYIDCRGILKVWRVDCRDISLLPVMEHGKLFSGDCYIVQYSYPGDEKDEILFFAWLGRHSIMDDRVDAVSIMCSMSDSTKGHPVVAQVFEGKETIQFLSVFQKLIIFKGGMSSGYKRYVSDNGFSDETYDGDKTALFRVQGSSPDNMQAIQVDLVSSSLNSSYCYILKRGGSFFTWTGNLSSARDHNLLDRMLDHIFPAQQIMSVREGSEPNIFWDAVGGKLEYPKEKEMKQWEEDPHLFTCTYFGGDFKVKEIFNFTQDDLMTEEVLVLDCYNEIYVWIGQHTEHRSNQQALALGKKFLEADILNEGLSPNTPIYAVTEGHEPSFFTRFFAWDTLKAYMRGNSFERKLAILKGHTTKMETPKRSPLTVYGTYQSEDTAIGSRSRSSILNRVQRRSGSPASHLWISSPEGQKSSRFSRLAPAVRNLFPGSPNQNAADEPLTNSLQIDSHEFQESRVTEEMSSILEKFITMKIADNEGAEVYDGAEVFPYERLKVTSEDPVTGIDVAKREAYLSSEGFQEKFGMNKEAFYKLPKWRQNQQKMALSLF